jgi:hypothetical protein
LAEVLDDDAPGNHVDAQVVGDHGDDGLVLASDVKEVDSEHWAAFHREAGLCCGNDVSHLVVGAQMVLEILVCRRIHLDVVSPYVIDSGNSRKREKSKKKTRRKKTRRKKTRRKKTRRKKTRRKKTRRKKTRRKKTRRKKTRRKKKKNKKKRTKKRRKEYLCNSLLPLAVLGPSKASTKHGVTLHDRVGPSPDGVDGNTPRHSEGDALVEAGIPSVLNRRLHVHALNRRQCKRLFGLFLLGCLGRRGRGKHVGELRKMDEGLGSEHILDGQLDFGPPSPRDDAHCSDAVSTCSQCQCLGHTLFRMHHRKLTKGKEGLVEFDATHGQVQFLCPDLPQRLDWPSGLPLFLLTVIP